MQSHTELAPMPAPAVGAFREQFENQRYWVQIYKHIKRGELEEIDPADRKCRKAPPTDIYMH